VPSSGCAFFTKASAEIGFAMWGASFGSAVLSTQLDNDTLGFTAAALCVGSIVAGSVQLGLAADAHAGRTDPMPVLHLGGRF